MPFEAVIGLEIHAQLLTATKIFCGCSTAFGAPPNTHVCPGLPRAAGRAAGAEPRAPSTARSRAALALGCTVQRDVDLRAQELLLSRPAEGLPDLAVRAAARDRRRSSSSPAAARRVRVGITRVHMEEDAGKSLHEGFADSDRKTYVDFNRSGVPLIEIVTEPDLRSAADAAAFFEPPARDPGRGSASTTATWKRAACAATPTSRCARAGSDGARHQGRGQEPQLVPLSAEGARVRDRPADRRARATAAASCRRRGCGTRRRARPSRCAARKRRTTTATFPSRTCRRSSSTPARRRARSRAALPELPEARRRRFVARVRAARVRRRRC